MPSDATVGVIDQRSAGQANTKDVAARAITAMAADGSLVTQYLQLLILADENGSPINLGQLIPLMTEIRDLLKEIRLHQELHGE
jgi:hypothetical protein